MQIEGVYLGGWFQRTTLHLTELFDFFNKGTSEMNFPAEKLKELHEGLQLLSVERKNGLLESLHAKIRGGLDLTISEDGLMVVRHAGSAHLHQEFSSMESYYSQALAPALALLFSKGAPVPKELAHIQPLFPFVVVARSASETAVKLFFETLKTEAYAQTESESTKVYKSERVILIVTRASEAQVRNLVEAQIFFREFKAQLHHYLSLHRTLWEKIASIKERGTLKGREVKKLRIELDGAQKTIKLIESRIHQMSSYLRTRAKMTASQKVDALLDQLFAYKFETLEDTLAYVKELWKMTDQYLSATLSRFHEIQAESTKNSITSLRLVTTLGVVAGIVGYLGKDALPPVTWKGGIFLLSLLIITWAFNEIVAGYYSRKNYALQKEKHELGEALLP